MKQPPFKARLHLTREQCRAVDEYAITELGIPGVVLMENAGRNAADHIERWIRKRSRTSSRPARTVIICGKGNNGGDGFVIARHLTHRGYDVRIDLVGDTSSMAGDAAVNYAIAGKMGVPMRSLIDQKDFIAAQERWQTCDVIVDAMLGTGFVGQIRDPLLSVVTLINELQRPLVVAIDLPSGLDANLGCTGGTILRADQTITFLAKKVSFTQPEAKQCLGRVTVCDIGAPTQFIVQQLGLPAS